MERCSYSSLKDFDWSVRLVLSSNQISGLREPLFQLKLDTSLPDGSVKETLVEMSQPELIKFIKRLQNAKKTVELISK